MVGLGDQIIRLAVCKACSLQALEIKILIKGAYLYLHLKSGSSGVACMGALWA